MATAKTTKTATTKKTASTAKKTTTASKKTASTAKKTTSASKKATSIAKKTTSTGTSVTEKKLLELYRAADADTKKAAMALLKGEKSQLGGVLDEILKNKTIMNTVTSFFK